jgi:hypothetical protein
VNYVWIRAVDVQHDPLSQVANETVRIDGHRASRGEDRLDDGRERAVLIIPDRRVLVVAVSADASLVGLVIESAFVT